MRIVLQMALRHMTPQLRDEYTGRLFQQKPIPITQLTRFRYSKSLVIYMARLFHATFRRVLQ